MKKLFVLAVIFALVFTSCEQPTDEDTAPKLPSLTIKNESSFILTNVTFSGISFATSGNDLPVSEQSVKQLKKEDLNKPGYITFTRKDIGIICRVPITIANEDRSFIFLDTTIVEEQANSSNTNTLAQITFLSKVAVELGGLTVPRNDIVDIEWFVNFTKQTEFTLKNTGVGKLLLTGTQPVKITGTGADAFSVVQPASSEIAPNGSLMFKISFTPGAVQNYNATVTISSNDQNGDFIFTISAKGVPPKPIATVLYGDNEISQNGTIDAGVVVITYSKNIAVEIRNTGTELLTLDTANISISGADAEAFTKTTNPGGSISVGNQTSFIIDCKPTKQSENNAVLTIPTNDNSRNPVVVYLKVTGVKGSAVLELTQTNTSTVIANNSLDPVRFGRVEIGSMQNLSFTIKNTGNIVLNLSETSPITSTNITFAILSQPVTKTLIPGASTTFTIRFTPTAEGDATAFIDIPNDSDEEVFTFAVLATGYVKRPQISVFYGNTEIPQYGTINVGDVEISQSKNITVIIKNTGEAVMTVDTANITITGEDADVFIRTTNPAANISVGGQTQFVIRYTPEVEGVHQATLTIPSNDNFRSPYIVYLNGNAPVTYQIGDTGPAGGIVFYDAGAVINGWRYLEASLTDFTAQWGGYSYSVGGTGLSIGDGKQNTQRIVTRLNLLGETGRAAQVCTNLNINGFKDWFLPSRDELNLMYQRRNTIGGFSTVSGSYYWTSSEDYNNKAWSQSFATSQVSSSDKYSTRSVRAIRAF